LILAIAAAVLAAPASGAGYYNMPTSLPQCLGMGFGPGYHAPMVLGPMMKAGIASQPVKRVPAALAAPYGGFDAPAVWSDGPAVEHWHGPMAGHVQQLPGIGHSILSTAGAIAPATHGTGFVGGVEVIPSPAAVGR
jgi:hypothetical protein